MRLFPLLALAFAASACRTTGAAALKDDSGQKPPPEILELFAGTFDPQMTPHETPDSGVLSLCRESIVTLDVLDPLTQEPTAVKIRLYVGKGVKDRAQAKTVIVMPPTGGENVLDRNYARLLCVNGYRAALVEAWGADTLTELDMDMHDRGAVRMVAALRHTVDFLAPLRPRQLGILGTSVGGISSVLVLALDARVSAGALIVTGGGMLDIIAASSEQTLARLRKERMEAFGLATLDEYREALRPHIKIDPLDFVGFTGKKPVWMMVATKDTTVPTKTQMDLYHAFGDQTLSTHADAHVPTIVFTAATKGLQIKRFFDEQLE